MEKSQRRVTAKSTANEVVAGLDLSGKVAVVTGGGAGIGLETSRALARAGASVLIAARDVGKAEEAAREINREVGAERVKAAHLDLADFASIRDFAAKRAPARIDILVANAGVMASPVFRTRQGLESTIGINHFGHFLLFKELLGAIEAAGNARVVVLSSGGHWWGAFDFEDWNWERRPFDIIRSYAESKTANTLFVVELERRFSAKGIHGYAIAPGLVNTTMGRHLTDEDNRKLGMTPEVRAMGKTPQVGAATVVWAATGPELEGRGGLYLQDGLIVEVGVAEVPNRGVAPFAVDPDLAKRLWTLSERVVGASG